MNREITLKLLVILACYAILAFAARKRWASSVETVWVGIAIIFWAIAWLMITLVKLTVGLYAPPWRAVLVALAMALPMALAMAAGLWFLVKRIQKSPEAPAPDKPKKKKMRRN